MTDVVLYIRVSTEEQAEKGFSLPAQQEKLVKYAQSKGLNILQVFQDDYSAWKGFNRPGYKELNTFIQKNKKQVNGILVTQWSRFSRDLTESLIELRRLKSLDIDVTAIEQETDDSIPENMVLKAIHLVMPQIENERLSQRTKSGIRQALKQGRWLSKAPYGYKNNKLTKLIEIDAPKAEIVKFCFERMASGAYNASEVQRMAKERGMEISKQGFLNILQNVVYAGKIKVPANKEEALQIVEGVHDAIIDWETLEHVGLILKGKKKPYKGQTFANELPLVGNLYCPKCNRVMTGSGSKGNGGVYHYYHCQRKYNCNNAFRAINANEAFESFLKEFEPKAEVLNLYNEVLSDVFKTNEGDRVTQMSTIEMQIKAIDKLLQKALDKNLADVWDDETYKSFKGEKQAKRNELLLAYNTLTKMPSEFDTYKEYAISLIGNLTGYYKQSSTSVKKKIVGSIFPEKIYFDNGTYRTTKINEVVGLIYNVGKDLQKNSPAKNARLSTVAPPSGLEPETL